MVRHYWRTAALWLATALPASSAFAQVVGHPINSPTSLYDDATLLAPGAASVDLYSSFSRSFTGQSLSAPGTDLAVGLTRRLELSAFSGLVYSKDGADHSYSQDDTYLGMKVLLLPQTAHTPAIAIKPLIEILSTAAIESYLGTNRANFALPVYFEKDFDSWSFSQTVGYISRGVAFSTTKIEADWWEHFTPMALFSYSEVTTRVETLSSLGLNRRQSNAELGFSIDINPRWSIFADAGPAIGRRDENSAGFELTFGVTWNTRLWGSGEKEARHAPHF